jgi:hypothetical protein
MFQKRQLFEHSQANITTHEPFIGDFETAAGTQKLISKSVERSVVIGAEQLSNADWDILSHIINSYRVQYYDTLLQRWFDVIIDKSKCTRQTAESTHSIELTLILPTPQLAI